MKGEIGRVTAGSNPDTAYRSQKNEEMLAKRGFISRIHRKKRRAARHRNA
jgi:hypothetical protein